MSPFQLTVGAEIGPRPSFTHVPHPTAHDSPPRRHHHHHHPPPPGQRRHAGLVAVAARALPVGARPPGRRLPPRGLPPPTHRHRQNGAYLARGGWAWGWGWEGGGGRALYCNPALACGLPPGAVCGSQRGQGRHVQYAVCTPEPCEGTHSRTHTESRCCLAGSLVSKIPTHLSVCGFLCPKLFVLCSDDCDCEPRGGGAGGRGADAVPVRSGVDQDG